MARLTKAEREHEARRDAEFADLRMTFGNPDSPGGRVLARLDEKFWGTRTGAVITAAGAIDPIGTVGHEYQRAVVCWLKEELRQAQAQAAGAPRPAVQAELEEREDDDRRD